MNAREIDQFSESPVRYSICTLVTDLAEYNVMLNSFQQAGFKNEVCNSSIPTIVKEISSMPNLSFAQCCASKIQTSKTVLGTLPDRTRQGQSKQYLFQYII